MLDHDFKRVMMDLFLSKLLQHARQNKDQRLEFLESLIPFMNDSIPPLFIDFIHRLKENENKKLNSLIDQLLAIADDQTIKTIILNMIINGYMTGKDMILNHEKKFGFLLPLMITYHFNREEPFYLYKRNVKTLIHESESIGIFIHQLMLHHPRFSIHQAIELAREFPKSVFLLYVDPKVIDLGLNEYLKGVHHVVILIQMDDYPLFNEALTKIRPSRKIIGGFARVNHERLENYLTDSHLLRLTKDNVPLQVLLPQKHHVLNHQLIDRINHRSEQPVITVDGRHFIHETSRRIIGKPRAFTIYSSGRTESYLGKGGSVYNRSLLKVLRETMPK